MSDLGQVVGSILAGLAQARRIADEETALIAEYYRSQPLLDGLSLPRIRVPQLIVDLPLLIEEVSPEKPEVLEKPEVIRKAVSERFVRAAAAEGVELPQAAKSQFEQLLAAAFREAGITSGNKASRTHDDVVRAVDRAFERLMNWKTMPQLSRRQATAISKAVQQEAAGVAVKEPRIPASVKVTVITSEVKDKSDPATVTRMKLVLREEGLEWTADTEEDGAVRRLTPE